MQNEYLTIQETASKTRKSVSTIRSWVRGYYVKNGMAIACKVNFPPAFKAGNRLLFRADEVENWINNNEKSNMSPMLA